MTHRILLIFVLFAIYACKSAAQVVVSGMVTGSPETHGCHQECRHWLYLPIFLPHQDTPETVHPPPSPKAGTGASPYLISLQNSPYS